MLFEVAVDVGASTGGFTDVLLTNGAEKVYAVEVGHGQLAWKLRNDARVVVLERTNARHLTPKEIPDPADWVVCDASFIGLETVLPAALSLNLTMFQQILGAEHLDGSYWTLQVELFFYAQMLFWFIVGGLKRIHWVIAGWLLLETRRTRPSSR